MIILLAARRLVLQQEVILERKLVMPNAMGLMLYASPANPAEILFAMAKNGLQPVQQIVPRYAAMLLALATKQLQLAL